MYKHSKKYEVPLYVIKNEEGELKKYAVTFSEGKHSDKYNRRISMGFTDHMLSDEVKKLQYDYELTPVSAGQIINAEKKPSVKERIIMVKDLQEKDIFADKLKSEVEKKLTGLEKNSNVV